MSGSIEVGARSRALVVVEEIAAIQDDAGRSHTTIRLRCGKTLEVDESYGNVVRKFADATKGAQS